MSDLDFDKVLADIVNSNGFQATSVGATRIKIAKTGANSSDNQRLLSIFAEAFPDQEFEAIEDEQGRMGVRNKPKLTRASESGQAIPEGYSTAIAQQGIKDLQVSLENASTDEERFSIASRLNTLVQTQKAYHFAEYKKRAEAEFGVPDLIYAIDRVKQAELASPFNPGTGMPSSERMQLLESLGTARTRAGARIQEMLVNDPTLSAAEALAKGTITEIQGRLVLEGRSEELDKKRTIKEARTAAISSMDPGFLESVSILKFNKVVPDLVTIGEQIYDGKLKLTDTERLLASADTENLKGFYLATKSPKEKGLALQILEQKELAIVGDEKQTKRNIALFKTLSEKNLSTEGDNTVSPEIKKRYKQAQTEVTAQAAASGRSRDEMLTERTVALKREMLGEVVKAAFYSDVSQWNGLIKSDATAQSVFKQAQGSKESMNLTKFVDQYLAYNDGRNLKDKGAVLRAMIMSATEALPRSAILPIPSPESMDLEAQRIVASRTMKNFMDLTYTPFSWNRAGVIADQLFKNKGTGQ